MLLLTAVDVEPDEIVDDYLETVRRGDLRAARGNRNNDEAEIEALCRGCGTTTEGAFRSALQTLDLAGVLDAGGMSKANRSALMNWRGAVMHRLVARAGCGRHGTAEPWIGDRRLGDQILDTNASSPRSK